MHFQQNLVVRRAEHCTAGSSCAVKVEKEDGSGRAAVQPPMSGCAALGDRAHAVPLASGARDGGENNRRVGADSCGEAAVAVRSWGSTPRRCGRGSSGEEGRRRRGGVQSR